MKELNIFEATALTSPNPLTLICSENEDGTTNLAPICFVSYLSFNPPMIGFATGKQAHTGERVRETGKVIVTVPGETLSQAVMSCGSSTGSKVNKATEYGIEMVDVENSSIKIPKDTKVAFVAETTKQMYHCVDAMNLVVIKNGIDLKRIQEYRRTHEKSTLRNLAGIKEDEILVSIFGTVCFRKGQRVFIEAARDLSKDKNRKLLFYIVGAKQSTYLNDLKRYIEENGLEEKVKIIEVCDDIYQYYMMSDYFVCASYEESSPQVVLEAMAFELPIVSTNVFGIPEQIRNECEALLVEPGNPIAIADALRRLMDDANLSDKLTQNGIYRLKSKFTYEMMLKNYDYLFQEAFQEGSRTELVKYWSVKK